MSATEPLATHDFRPGEVEAVLQFLKRTRNELRMLRKVRVWIERIQVFDVNGDFFEIRGIGYPDSDAAPLLTAIGANFKPELLHQPVADPFKEYKTGRRYPWAQDRVM